MKKIIIFSILTLFIVLVACQANGDITVPADVTTELETTTEAITETIEITTTEQRTTLRSDIIPPELGQFRPIFYSLSAFYANLVDREILHAWEMARIESGEFHRECVAVSFIRDFNISREDFEQANERERVFLEERGLTPQMSANYEIYDVDLIFTFDNEKINEFFSWDNWPYDSWA